MFEHVKRSWEEFGEQEPYWSVLAADDFKQDSIKTTKDRFCRSGYDALEMIKAFFSRNGQSLASVTSCLELGCGVARVTSALAAAVPRVYGVDVSTAHIALANKWVASVSFQIPTNCEGYSFRWKDYLGNLRTGMEMHALPQERVFDLCARHGIRLIEIQEDTWTASPAFRSNGFFGRKAA